MTITVRPSLLASVPRAALAGFVAEHGVHSPLVHHEVEQAVLEREVAGIQNLHSCEIIIIREFNVRKSTEKSERKRLDNNKSLEFFLVQLMLFLFLVFVRVVLVLVCVIVPVTLFGLGLVLVLVGISFILVPVLFLVLCVRVRNGAQSTPPI